MVTTRLPDGSRLEAVIPPLALDGPLVSIRRGPLHVLSAADLLAAHALTEEMLLFLSACVQARLNLLISGGASSGKATLLNVLSSSIPAGERTGRGRKTNRCGRK